MMVVVVVVVVMVVVKYMISTCLYIRMAGCDVEDGVTSLVRGIK